MMNYERDSRERPSKRARNAQDPLGALHRDSVTLGSVVEASALHSIEGPGSLRLQEGPSIPGGTGGRTREDKNRKLLSCKECRRLKLKCDRKFPCQSCVKRGCGSLCPEGALTSGRGSRFILANTEQLHEKNTELSTRVRQLEEALETLQGMCSDELHPLLAPELLRIKTSQELYGTTANIQQQNSGSTSEEPFAAAKDDNLGKFVNALSLNNQYDGSRGMDANWTRRDSTPPEVPSDILQLSATFPFPWSVDLKIRKQIRDALPPRPEAERMCDEARRNALWQYNLDASETFLPNLLHYCYNTHINDLRPRRLALLLMVLSIGSLVDLHRPLGSLHGEAYHHLARAAVCEIPLMEEPDFDVLHTLFFMIWYHLIFSDNKKAVGYAWNLMGFVAKLAQGLGLHRDGSRLKVIPEEHERRRAVFWELLNMDCRMSLSLGRPPSISLSHVDTKPPSYVGGGQYVPKEEIAYHEWKNGFFVHCLTPILEAINVVESPSYERILELDKAVRDFAVPALMEDQSSNDNMPRFLVMQRALVTMGREIALLQLHRRNFTEAMNCTLPFDLNHPYALSVLATYLGASSLISALDSLFTDEQQLSVRFLHFWFNTFSAAVTLSLLISRAPSTPLATYALQDLERTCQLFRRAAIILPFSGRALPIMNKLAERARRTLMQCHSTTDNGNGHLNYAIYPQPPQPSLPVLFAKAHSCLAEAAERVRLGTILPQDFAIGGAPQKTPTTWLPDVYRFTSVGLGTDDRYAVALPQPTPFVPSAPRVAESVEYNFDHGALTAGLVEETSYMAWF